MIWLRYLNRQQIIFRKGSHLKEMKRLSDLTDNAVDKITRCKIFSSKRRNFVQI